MYGDLSSRIEERPESLLDFKDITPFVWWPLGGILEADDDTYFVESTFRGSERLFVVIEVSIVTDFSGVAWQLNVSIL